MADLLGIRIYYDHLTTDGPIFVHRPFAPATDERGAPSDFSVLFRALLPSLDDYAWLIDRESVGQIPCIPGPAASPLDRDTVDLDALFDACAQYRDGFALVRAPGFMKRFARYVTDDWNNFYGFRPPADALPDLAALSACDLEAVPSFAGIDVFFRNWDGVYWALFTPHAELLDAVRSDWAGEPRVTIVDTSWNDTVAMHEREAAEWAREWENRRSKP